MNMMGSFSLVHWLVVLAIVLILFGGGGKIKSIMGDLGGGLKAFKTGAREADNETAIDRITKP